MKNDINPSRLLDVHQAARYLGVHAGTIRRWSYSKQLKGVKVGVRGDWRFTADELIKLAKANEETPLVTTSETTKASSTEWNQTGHKSHFVQFYEDDTFLIDSVRDFIDQGHTALVVATQAHIDSLEKGLKIYGSELSEARRLGKYISLDATVALSHFMVEDLPDSQRFFDFISSVLSKADTTQHVRIFGEMVAILWAEGKQAAAVKLEELWNEFQKTADFSLACAYPLRDFKGHSHAESVSKISSLHSHVFPTESYSELLTDDQRLLEITVLQQKAQTLEAEVARRQEVEDTLRQTMKELKKSEEFNRSIIENSADCIKVLDLEGSIVTVNQTGCKVFEIEDITSYLGKSYIDFWPGEYASVVVEALEKAKQGEQGRFKGFCPTVTGNPKWWDVVITPMYTPNGSIEKLLATSRDISEEVQLEQRKDDFLNATSHELKTPLTSQMAFIQLLQRIIIKNDDTQYLKYLGKISEQTNKLARLVQDLLDGTKIKAGKLCFDCDAFDINECVQRVIEDIQPTTSHTIELVGRAPQTLYGNEERIGQVVTNLIENAIKYSPNSDKIVITIEGTDQQVTLRVTDFGIGIPKQDLPHAFDRFYRVGGADERTYPGLGMGLYISSEIIKGHKGNISVESSVGKGSTFSFTLPLIVD